MKNPSTSLPWRILLPCGVILLALFGGIAQGAPLGTAFTYHGRLSDGGLPATGEYDLQFKLYDALTGGLLAGTPTIITLAPVSVTNGLFLVTLDFGGATFAGNARWLEIGVRTNGSTGDFTTLAPRQPLTPTPYAIFAPSAGTAASAATATSVPWTGLTSMPSGFADGVDNDTTYVAGSGLSLSGPTFAIAPSGVASSMLADGAVNGAKIAGNQVVKSLNALRDEVTLLAGDNIAVSTVGNGVRISATVTTGPQGERGPQGIAGPQGAQGPAGATGAIGATGATGAAGPPGSADAWGLAGNRGTTPAANFLGTADDQPLELKVNGARALRLEPNSAAPNFIGGYGGNSLGSGLWGATIGGGGALDVANSVTGNFGTVGGGAGNVAGGLGVVSGGYSNQAGDYATVPGGYLNIAAAPGSFAAGRQAKANHANSFVWNDGVDFASTADNQFLVHARGGVGIGTSEPTRALDVRDGTGASGDGGAIHVGGNGANGDAKMIFFGDGEFVRVGENGIDDTMELRASRFHFVAGNVGIGAAEPAERLEVAGAVTIGNTATPLPKPGTIRWTGNDFEGFNGVTWVSLTGNAAADAVVPVVVPIQPGTFTMGSPASEKDRLPNEGPQMTVTISRPFWMGKYPVTFRQYLALIGSLPLFVQFADNLSRPAEVYWSDATNYCAKLTQRETAAGNIPITYLYRLPTEAEWEYACRAGTVQRYHFGEDPFLKTSVNYMWIRENAGATTHAVGGRLPNPWGLYDMGGNTYNWCQDWYGPYPGGSLVDPQGPPSGSKHVVRGGQGIWIFHEVPRADSRSASRDSWDISQHSGFRVVLALR